MKTRLLTAAVILIAAISASAQPHPQDKGYNHVQNISYTSADETDAYRKERCVISADIRKLWKEYSTSSAR